MGNRKWKIVGINFDHWHMGDLLRMAMEHPHAEVVGVSDEDLDRIQPVVNMLDIPGSLQYSDYDTCIRETQPDLIILCSSTATHAEWTERLAHYGKPILIEKPFAASLEECDRMIAAMESSGQQLIINWPLRWYPPHITSKRLIDEGTIGEVIEIHYYDGNRGPLFHREAKIPRDPNSEEKNTTWWYQKDQGGGALLDYLGYGTTLGTWFMNGKVPIEVSCMTHGSAGLVVDEHSVSVVRYDVGLSTFETRWGTFSDPWMFQPQPKCGFVIRGTKGTIGSYDYESVISIQTEENPEIRTVPVDEIEFPFADPISYVIHCLENDVSIDCPLSVKTSRIGQQIVDTAFKSAELKKTLPLQN